MKAFHFSRKFRVIATTIGGVGMCAALYTHHLLASRAAVPLSIQSLTGTWSGTASGVIGPLGKTHPFSYPLQATFRPDGKVMFDPRSQAEYSVQGNSLIFSHIINGDKPIPHPITRRATIVGDTLTWSNPFDARVVLRRT